MRITNSMMTSKFLSEANKALNRVDKYQSQVNSTKRISGIADDPQSALMALKARNKLSNLELYQSNIATASSYLKEAESATSSLNLLLQSAYEDIISAQSAKTPEDLKILAEDLKNLQDEVLSISRSSLGTSYIFGGFNFTGKTNGASKDPPFTVEDVTGHLLYNGINLSKISWKADFDAGIGQMTGQMMTDATDGTDLRSLTSAFSNNYDSYSDTYAKEQGQKILSSLDTVLSGADAAMTAALKYELEFGSNSEDFKPLKLFHDELTIVRNELALELSKDMAGSYIIDTDVPIEHRLTDGTIDYDYYQQQGMNVYTQDELDNLKFNKETVYSILSVDVTNSTDPEVTRSKSVLTLMTGDGSAPSQMTSAINKLTAVITTPADATDFETSMKNATDLKAGGTDLIALIGDYNTADDAREQAQKILGSLKTIVSDARTAIEIAGTYGIDIADYQSYIEFTDDLADVTSLLEQEVDDINFEASTVSSILVGSLSTLQADIQAEADVIMTAVEAGTPPDGPNVIKETGNSQKLQIGTSQTVDVTFTGLELLGSGSDNIYHILGKAVSMLNGEANPEGLSQMITSIQNAQSDVLTLGTRIGATQNRMTLMSSRYDSSKLNYTEMRSNAEDADMAEAIINLTEAQTVYNAALAGGAEILKTSLIDFLR